MSHTTRAIKDDLRSFIRENFLFGDELDIGDDDSFLDSGIIDSTGILELIGHLESKYNIRIEDDELAPENLDSLNRLESFIHRKSKA